MTHGENKKKQDDINKRCYFVGRRKKCSGSFMRGVDAVLHTPPACFSDIKGKAVIASPSVAAAPLASRGAAAFLLQYLVKYLDQVPEMLLLAPGLLYSQVNRSLFLHLIL